MLRPVRSFILGKSTLGNGVIALAIFSLIALGCTCNKSFDLANSSSNSNSTTTSGNSSGDPFGKTTSSSDSEMPDDALLQALVKETTADFAAAISSGDFTDIYNKASMDFRQTYTLQQTQDVFKDFIEKKGLVSPILARAMSMEPEFSPDPSIRHEQGLTILVTNGKYDTKPVPTRFEYEYVSRGGQWKLLKLVVKLVK